MSDLVIRNAKLMLPRGVVPGELSAEGGVIRKIAATGIPKGEVEIDAKGKLVIPGVIDAHVHVYDPKFIRREDFRSGSTSAAAGGVTAFIVMPWDTPVLTSESARQVIAAGQRESLVDFALHAGNFTAETVGAVRKLSAVGIKSFKAFTCSPYRLDPRAMGRLMGAVKDVGGTIFVHAEDDETIRRQQGKLMAQGRKDPLAHHESRPNEAEETAVKKTMEQARKEGCKLHLAHITTRQACGAIKGAKEKGRKITAEVTTHHLIFSRDDVSRLGPYLKVNPSLKTRRDQAALWKALAERTIDMAVTDHAPGTRGEKEVGWGDIWKAQTGVPGLETLLPLMLGKGLADGRLTLERMVDALCTAPARTFGLYPKKGVIKEGSDADIVVVDTKKKTTISAKSLHYKIGWTPYENLKVKGAPTATVSRGEVIFEEGCVLGKRGRGKYLPV